MKKNKLHSFFKKAMSIRKELTKALALGVILLLCATSTVEAQYCTTGDCNPNTFLNASDPNTIEYDNMVSSFHSTMMRQPDGKLMVWGEGMASDGTGHLLVPTEVNNTNYPGLTGDVLKFTLGSYSNTFIAQKIVLTTDGLFAWGNEGHVISAALTTSDAFQKVSIGTYGVDGGTPKADGLPAGVTPQDVNMMFGSYKVLSVITCSGEAWVLSEDNYRYGDNASLSAANNMVWHRVHIDAGTTLDNVVALRGNGYAANGSASMALTSGGKVYTWGRQTRLGDGTGETNRNFATEMTLPAGVTPKMIGATGKSSSDPTGGVTYYLLGTNGNVYSLGEGQRRQLGNFTTTGSNTWVQVQKSATAGDYLTGVAWISPNEHDIVVPAINVLTADGRLWSWGSNDGKLLGGANEATPLHPTEMSGSIAQALPYDLAKLNWTDKVIAVETGGHTSMIVKDNSQKYGYVGHRINGSMGDGTSSSAYEDLYNFGDTPEIDLCGTEVIICNAGNTAPPLNIP